jgi:hypothetical protein
MGCVPPRRPRTQLPNHLGTSRPLPCPSTPAPPPPPATAPRAGAKAQRLGEQLRAAAASTSAPAADDAAAASQPASTRAAAPYLTASTANSRSLGTAQGLRRAQAPGPACIIASGSKSPRLPSTAPLGRFQPSQGWSLGSRVGGGWWLGGEGGQQCQCQLLAARRPGQIEQRLLQRALLCALAHRLPPPPDSGCFAVWLPAGCLAVCSMPASLSVCWALALCASQPPAQAAHAPGTALKQSSSCETRPIACAAGRTVAPQAAQAVQPALGRVGRSGAAKARTLALQRPPFPPSPPPLCSTMQPGTAAHTSDR